AAPAEVFEAVVTELRLLLGAGNTRLMRYEPGGAASVIATSSEPGMEIPVGSRIPLDGQSVAAEVWRTGRAARLDRFDGPPGSVADTLRQLGVRLAVGARVLVEDRLWGVMVAGWRRPPAASGLEDRIGHFSDVVATAISNAQSRSDLAASRARVVAAADETRRRIERDLHDGAQQRLVLLALQLRAAQAAVPPELGVLKAELSRSVEGLAGVLEELREIARGIHPAILAEGGLGAALKTLARRSPIPVELDVHTEARLPERVEVAAYYVVSEMLTNAAKHAHAAHVRVDVEATNGVLRVGVSDDGAGGADPARGSGLVGLKDRVESLGGAISVQSPPGEGTSLDVELPIVD